MDLPPWHMGSSFTPVDSGESCSDDSQGWRSLCMVGDSAAAGGGHYFAAACCHGFPFAFLFPGGMPFFTRAAHNSKHPILACAVPCYSVN